MDFGYMDINAIYIPRNSKKLRIFANQNETK
jgi:hypothetical protein